MIPPRTATRRCAYHQGQPPEDVPATKDSHQKMCLPLRTAIRRCACHQGQPPKICLSPRTAIRRCACHQGQPSEYMLATKGSHQKMCLPPRTATRRCACHQGQPSDNVLVTKDSHQKMCYRVAVQEILSHKNIRNKVFQIWRSLYRGTTSRVFPRHFSQYFQTIGLFILCIYSMMPC